MKSNPLAKALAANQRVPQPQSSERPPAPKHPARPGKRQISVYLPIPVHEYLRRFAFESRRSMHSVLMEGLDRVLQKHGTSIEKLVKSGESA